MCRTDAHEKICNEMCRDGGKMREGKTLTLNILG